MVQRSRAALQRYLFYCNRYMNHMQSLRFEHKLYAQVKQKMEEMQQHNMSWIEVQFLKKAVDVLCQCRSTLMFTYVFAFYLKKNNQSIIFEVGHPLRTLGHTRGHTRGHKRERVLFYCQRTELCVCVCVCVYVLPAPS